jgi:tetratricopeptide (TPR) repeat protein
VEKARTSSDPGYYLNANACADIALDLSPGDPLALDLRGLVLLNEHKFRQARDLARSILDEHPDSAMAWGSLSDALFEIGEVDQAELAAQKMMELKPNLPSYGRVSYFQWLGGDGKGALESARLALDAGRDPRNLEPLAWVVVQTAMMFWHRGDYEGADAGFERALAMVSEYPPALVGRGRAAMARGDARRAADLFERAYRQSPLTETAGLLSDALEMSGDTAGAEKALDEAEKEGRRADKRTLSLLYSARDKRPEDALRLAREEREVRGDPYTDDALAFALYRNGRFEEAHRIVARWGRYGAGDARLLFHRGAIEIAAGQKAAGKELLAAALAQNPHFDARGAVEAKHLLEAN